MNDHMCAPAVPKWYTLMRRAAGEEVGGRVRLAFEWDITARGLLALKLAALERVLAQRTEILCMLHPVTPSGAAAWSAAPGRHGLLFSAGRSRSGGSRGSPPRSPAAAGGSGAATPVAQVLGSIAHCRVQPDLTSPLLKCRIYSHGLLARTAVKVHHTV